jgi:hypothetical protein
MKPRILAPLAALLVSLPLSAAFAQPAPDAKPAPDAPPPDKAPPDKAPPDKAPPDSGAPRGEEAKPAEAKPADARPAEAEKGGEKPAEKGENGGEKPSSEPGPAEGRPLKLSANGFTVWPVALLQTQITPYVGKDASFLAGDIAERPGFRLRRARFGVGGSYDELIELEVSGEVYTERQTVITLHEAWVGVKPKPYFGASMGILPVPFSRSALISSADTALIDRPLAVRALAPFHQLGALVGGSIAERFHYSLGIYNGFERSDQFYYGWEEPLATLGNRFSNLAYAARVAASLDSPGADIPRFGDTKNRLNIGASYFFNDGGARTVHSAEADIFFQRSGVRLLAEGLYSVAIPSSQPTIPTDQTSSITSFAVVAEGGYTYQNLIGGHVRFEYIDPNTAVDDAADNWLFTVGVTFAPPRIGQYAKAQLEYTHREEIHGKSVDNDSVTLQTQFALR